MVKDEIIAAASLAPASELLSQLVLDIIDTTHAAKQVVIQRENFNNFSTHLEKTTNIFKELSKQNLNHSESLYKALEYLNQEIKVAKQLCVECSKRNKVYLLVNCRKIVKRIDRSTKEISRALSLIPIASLDVSSRISSQVGNLCEDMLNVEYRAALAEEEILEKIDLGLQQGNHGRSSANDLMLKISEALGFSNEKSKLKKEFEEFKREIDDANLRKELAESLQMQQIIALLENADATTSSEEKEKKYFERRNSLGSQLLGPLQWFSCPITHDIMVDPVETSSGQTFERSAIEKWISEGSNICPMTGVPLDTSVLRPNKNLRLSIEEWRDRNTIITISLIKPKLLSSDEEEVLQSLDQLQKICVERELQREWVAMEDYIPVLIGLLGSKNREIKKHALVILSMLVKDGEENKEKVMKVNNALESIVRFLARPVEESRLALHLLSDLSTISLARGSMGNVQGCIFLVVNLALRDDAQVSRDAEQLLQNLSFLDQNVKQMAKANYFRPLLHLLSTGPDDVKKNMAETLGEIELTDHIKLSIARDGALRPLLLMLSEDDLEMKKSSVKALLNLSGVQQNGQQIIKEGAVRPLFEILYRHSLSMPTLRKQVAATIMHLAISTTIQDTDSEPVFLLESDEDIFKLFSLISLTEPDIQCSILKTFHALCLSPSGLDIRKKLRQLSVVQALVQLCEAENDAVRKNSVKLFYCLTKDGNDKTSLEHVGERCIRTLLNIIESLNDVEETAAALGIIANLPNNPQMTQCFPDELALNVIGVCIKDGNRTIVENAVGALCRFTVPTNKEWQKRVAEAGIIQVLVQLLASGTSLTKQNAAISLKQLSESSYHLSKPVKKHGVFHCCFAAQETVCPVHLGKCGVESSFCILESNALEPLVRMLSESDIGVCEASLDVLLTLISGEIPQFGSKVLDEANAIAPLISLLSSNSVNLLSKCLMALEKIFQLEELRRKYGNSAQMHMVDIAQRKGNDIREIKSLAARILSQLGVLGTQSSFL